MLPAVDLLGGRVVRLHQGRYDRATAYPVEPVELALRYAAAGATGCTSSISTRPAPASARRSTRGCCGA